ncbi:MAG: Hsp70 family protein, partial [Candidatus Marinimicrobia bacterium]|nr:Hsp70 family protein [Candidatus Neomarinimicrobiota bacterium]
EVFSTAADGQTSVEIHVLQGERSQASYNKTLGRFILDGIPSAARGIPQVEVTFDIDVNGILNVSAKDKATNKEQNIRIEASSGLTDAEIEKMKRDAEANAADDEKWKKIVDTHNQAEQILFSTRKQLTEFGDKLTDEDKKPVEDALDELEKIKENKEPEQIEEKINAVQQAMMKVSEKMYADAQAQEQPGPDAGAGAAGPEAGAQPDAGENAGPEAKEEVVEDADFEEMK